MGILPGSGPLGSGPTGPGSGFSVMPLARAVLMEESKSLLTGMNNCLEGFHSPKRMA